MRALVVHAGNLSGGVERVLASMARLTRERGAIDLEFALVFDGPVADALRATGAPVHVIGPARASRPLSVWRARRRLEQVITARAPEVAVTQSAWSLALFGGVVRGRGLPLVHSVHDALGGGHWTERLAARHRPDLLLCNSAYSASCAVAVFPGVEHVVLYEHAPRDAGAGSGIEPRAAVRERLATAGDAVVIVQVGRADPLKGHRVLIEALARLSGDPRWVSWQVGGPQSPAEAEYWKALGDLARARGVGERVRFVGPQSDVASVLRAADIYCQPNIGPEAFGLTLVEAMAAALPIVTSRIGAAPEVLDGTRNILLPAGDAIAVAEALRMLIDDPGTRRSISADGPARAHRLENPDTAHQVFLDALDRVTRSAHAA